MTGFAVTVVVPCLNEVDNVEPLFREVAGELAGYDGLEVLFVDDGSTDGTLDRIRDLAAREPTVSYLSFTRNFGLEAAFSAGYRYARHPWVLHLDADLQFPPAEAHKLVERAKQGQDAVFGVRVDRRDPWLRRTASKLHELIAGRVLGIELPPGGTTFRLVRADLARRIVDLRQGTPYFLATLPRLTRHWTTVPIAHRPRVRGGSKVTVRGLARHAVELFMSYSLRPIRWAGLACLAGAAMAAGAVVLRGAVGLRLVAPTADRLAAGLTGLALAAGLLALAVIARYLVHIAAGQRRMPQFLIREASIPVRPEDRS